MKWRLPVSFLIILLVAFAIYWVLQNARRMKITTAPVSAQVYLDGRYVGNTPCVLQTLGRHILELKADGFYPVSYSFDPEKHLAQGELPIRLAPTFYGCHITEDWSLGLCDYLLFKAQNPGHAQTIDRLGQENNVYFSILSPDGRLIAYATTGGPYNKFWLLSLEHPEDGEAIFKDVTTDTDVRGVVPLEFSPNSEWISLWSNGTLMVAPADDSQKLVLKVEDASYGRWSEDGQWLAVFLYRGQRTVIYHFANNRWAIFSSPRIAAAPVAFSFDNRYLFTEDWFGSNWLKVMDVAHQMQLVRQYSLAGDSGQFFNPIESLDGKSFAIAPYMLDSKTGIQTGILLFGRFDENIQAERTDENYLEVLYWLEGDRQVAVLVGRDDTLVPDWMSIVDVPAGFSR